MRKQPKYSFFKNTLYALKGLKDIILNETSFKIELLVCIIILVYIIFIDIVLINKMIIFSSLFLILIAESINSAIERIVDLVTNDYDEMAGRAKDIGSTIVFLTILLSIILISYVIYDELYL